MHLRRPALDLIEAYDVLGEPVVSATGLTYLPRVSTAVEPYEVTRLPIGAIAVSGLRAALVRAGQVPVAATA